MNWAPPFYSRASQDLYRRNRRQYYRQARQPRYGPARYKRLPYHRPPPALMGLSTKFADFQRAATSLSLSWSGSELDPAVILSISTNAQGDTESTHDGRSYWLTGFTLRYSLERRALEASTDIVGDVTARVIVYLDTQTNGAQAQGEQVMEEPSVVADWLGGREMGNLKRFKILYDKTDTLPYSRGVVNEGAVNSFANAPVMLHRKVFRRFKYPFKVNTTGTGGNITDCADNSLHIIAVTGASTPEVDIEYHCRTYFKG